MIAFQEEKKMCIEGAAWQWGWEKHFLQRRKWGLPAAEFHKHLWGHYLGTQEEVSQPGKGSGSRCEVGNTKGDGGGHI